VTIEDTFLQQVAAQYLANSSSTVRPLVVQQPLPSEPASPSSHQYRDDDHYSPAELVQNHVHRLPAFANGYLNSELPATLQPGQVGEPARQVLAPSLLPPFESPEPFAINHYPALTVHPGAVISSATPAVTPAKPQAGSKKSSLQEYKLLEDAFWNQTEAIVPAEAAKAPTQPRAMLQAVPHPSAPRAPAAFAMIYQHQMTKGDHQAMLASNLAEMKAANGTATVQNGANNKATSNDTRVPPRPCLPPKPVISMAPSPPASSPAIATSPRIHVMRSTPIASSQIWTWTPDERTDNPGTQCLVKKKSRFDVPPPANSEAMELPKYQAAPGQTPACLEALGGLVGVTHALDGKRKLAEAEALLDEAEKSQRNKDWSKSDNGQRLSFLLTRVEAARQARAEFDRFKVFASTRIEITHKKEIAEAHMLLEEASEHEYGKPLSQLTQSQRLALVAAYTHVEPVRGNGQGRSVDKRKWQG